MLHSEALRGMQKKPGMYFTPPFFNALQHYVMGVHQTLHNCESDIELRRELDDFDEWVCTRLGVDMPHTSWVGAIERHETDESARVALFADLLLAYRAEKSNRPG